MPAILRSLIAMMEIYKLLLLLPPETICQEGEPAKDPATP